MSHAHLLRRLTGAVVVELAAEASDVFHRLTLRAAAAIDRAEATSGKGRTSDKEIGRQR